MDSRDEIAAIKRRLGALEYELAQLKLSLSRFETAQEREPTGSPLPPTTPAVAEPPPLEPLAARTAVPLPENTEQIGAVPPPPTRSSAPVAHKPIETPAVSAPPTPSAPPRPHPLREWLEPLQLWPPSGEENTEVRLAAWWATRLGALLAVIGVVFLGVYVSQNSPPWLRLTEVAAATIGVIGLGGWLERKLPKFGGVVFGAGLALAYFCAFAAYAVPPMKVIVNPFAAMACELIVVTAILCVAWWRSSPVVATMAVALGYVTAFLALRGETAGFGAWVVLLLGGASVVLRLARAWDAPSALAMPLTWLFLATSAIARGPGHDMPVHAVWMWSVLHLALFMSRDWIPAWRGGVLSATDRALQVINSSLPIVVGLVAAFHLGDATVTRFFFGSGVLMLLAAWGWRSVRADVLVPIFVCKGAGLITLGVIDAFAGQMRCLVLLAQAFVMLVSARQSRLRWLRTATVIVGVIALGFFLTEVRAGNAPFAVRETALEMIFLAGAMAFVAALQRWVAFGSTATAVGSVIVGGLTVAVAANWQVSGWTPAIEIAAAIALVGAAATVRGWMPAGIAAGIVMVAAHVALWNFATSQYPRATLWWNQLVVLAAVVASAPAISRVADERARSTLRLIATALPAATLVVVAFKGFDPAVALAASAALAVMLVSAAPLAIGWPFAVVAAPLSAFACALYGLSPHHVASPWLWAATVAAWAAPIWLTSSRRHFETIASANARCWSPPALTALATIILLIALATNLRTVPQAFVMASTAAALAVFGVGWTTPLRSALEASWVLWAVVLGGTVELGASGPAWFAALAAWVPAVAMVRSPRATGLTQPPPFWRGQAVGIQVAVATIIGGFVASDGTGALKLAAFAGLLVVAFSLWRWAGVAAARPAAVAITAMAWAQAAHFIASGQSEGWGASLAGVSGTAIVAALLPFALERDASLDTRRRGRWTGAIAGLLLVFAALIAQRGAVAPFATVGCGVAAVGLFLVGLFARSRPHRLTGLAGLALCVPRAFLVDLHSTLHRIAAFVALGVVLLWVGFSYHRFRHLIVDEEKNR